LKTLSRLDVELGMGSYGSESPPCSATARSSTEDFQVEEVISLQEMTDRATPGYFPVYRVRKRSIDTLHMEGELSKALGSRVSYGGLKDSRAVAVQYVTPKSSRSELPPRVDRPGFEAVLVGYLPGPITRGSVIGNRFAITLKECCPAIEESIREVLDMGEKKTLPNFFGYQRFGVSGAGTHAIGEAIVKRRFEHAVDLILTAPRLEEDDGARGAREEMAKGNYRSGAELLPQGQDIERAVARRMAEDPSDKVTALRGLPVEVRRLSVQAYQSYIFNRALSEAMARDFDISAAVSGDNWAEVTGGARSPTVHGAREPPSPGSAPMVQLAGFAYRDYGSRFDALTAGVMEEEGVSAKDFYVKEMQEASAEGGFRVAHLLVSEPNSVRSGDTALLSFRLGRGQYATVLLREIIKPSDPLASGLA
jgi:tRNA pseudouridine13 synthase